MTVIKSSKLPLNFILICVFALFAVVVPSQAHAWGPAAARSQSRCYSYTSAVLMKSVRYCLDQNFAPGLGTAHKPTLFFFHGIMRNEQYWWKAGYAATFRRLSASGVMPATTVVTFNTEHISFFADHQGITRGPKAYETWFLNEFVDFVGKKHNLCTEHRCLGLAGESMGGFGALKNALKRPDRFGFAAVSSPALPPEQPSSIFAPDSLWRRFFFHQPIGALAGMTFLRQVRRVFGTEMLYRANDPNGLALSFGSTWGSRGVRFPHLYVNVGGRDQFGFDQGYQKFLGTLRRIGVSPSGFFSPQADHFRSDGVLHTPLLEHVGMWFKGQGFL